MKKEERKAIKAMSVLMGLGLIAAASICVGVLILTMCVAEAIGIPL